MGGLRTSHLVLLAMLSARPAVADTETLRLLATCTGRLSALMEHQWLTDGPASEATRDARDAMAALADAATPAGQGALTMDWRIKAKAAQAALLMQARFGKDPGGRAAARAQALVADCRSLLLG